MNERRYSCNQIIRQAEIVRLRLHATSVRQGGAPSCEGLLQTTLQSMHRSTLTCF